MTGADRHVVTLSRGLWREGAWHRDAALRPITWSDDEFLAGPAADLPDGLRVIALLERCVSGLGPGDPAAALRELCAGDREALLLHLRRITLGDRLQCILGCPQCGEPMDADLEVADLVVSPYADATPVTTLAIEDDGQQYEVDVRLPSGADLEAAARASSPEEGAAGLLAACVLRVEGGTGGMPDSLAVAIEDRIADLDPQAEVRLQVACPECGFEFSALFDAAAYLFAEIDMRAGRLHREVHALAWHYHWGETEIMGMTAAKRRRYLELLAEELAQARGAA